MEHLSAEICDQVATMWSLHCRSTWGSRPSSEPVSWDSTVFRESSHIHAVPPSSFLGHGAAAGMGGARGSVFLTNICSKLFFFLTENEFTNDLVFWCVGFFLFVCLIITCLLFLSGKQGARISDGGVETELQRGRHHTKNAFVFLLVSHWWIQVALTGRPRLTPIWDTRRASGSTHHSQ